MKNAFATMKHPIMRVDLLKAMDQIIYSMDDETPYYRDWIEVIPDCPDDDDFKFIASDDEMFDLVCKTFQKIIKEIE